MPVVGPGQAIATRLAAEGACVVIADLNLDNAQAVAAELGGDDVAIGVQADVTDEAQIAAAVQEAVLAFGGLDLVVNNAGLSISKPLLETTEKDWDLQHNVMAKGSFLVSKAAAKAMIDQGMGGDIVYISSKNSVFACPNNIAYSATKADQAHQVRLLAAELGEYGIRVNCINPDGVVRGSGIFAGGWGAKRAAVYGVDEQELGKYYAQRTLLKREVLPEHVANAAAVLTSNELSLETVHRFPNGVVELDGGLHWDFGALFEEVLQGLAAAAETAAASGERITQHRHRHVTVDYGLVDASGSLRTQPFSYRDERGRTAVANVHKATTGLQFLQFNALYQLATERGLCGVQALLIPDRVQDRN